MKTIIKKIIVLTIALGMSLDATFAAKEKIGNASSLSESPSSNQQVNNNQVQTISNIQSNLSMQNEERNNSTIEQVTLEHNINQQQSTSQSSKKKYVCDYPGCNYSTDMSCHLTEHKQGKHASKKFLVCDFPGCTFKTKWQRSLNGHKRNKHLRPKPLKPNNQQQERLNASLQQQSEIIQNNEDTSQNLNNINPQANLNINTEKKNEKKFRCETCKKGYTTESSLTRHINSIHNKIKHRCPHCNKEFNDNSNLKKHINGVHKEIKHRCKICNNEFTEKGSLTKHTRRKHTCKHCSWTGKDLKEHIKEYHQQEQGTSNTPEELFNNLNVPNNKKPENNQNGIVPPEQNSISPLTLNLVIQNINPQIYTILLLQALQQQNNDISNGTNQPVVNSTQENNQQRMDDPNFSIVPGLSPNNNNEPTDSLPQNIFNENPINADNNNSNMSLLLGENQLEENDLADDLVEQNNDKEHEEASIFDFDYENSLDKYFNETNQ